jgi:hypothetical protein
MRNAQRILTPRQPAPMLQRRRWSAYGDQVMDIRQAFAIEDPLISLPWGIGLRELQASLPGVRLQRVTHFDHVLPVTVLGGLQCMLALRFGGPQAGLSALELFRASNRRRRAGFAEFQQHLEASFGPPTSTQPGLQGFPTHHWRLPGGVEIEHYAMDRFGPEAHACIRRID